MFAFIQQVENTALEFILNVTSVIIATLRALLHCHLLPSGWVRASSSFHLQCCCVKGRVETKNKKRQNKTDCKKRKDCTEQRGKQEEIHKGLKAWPLKRRKREDKRECAVRFRLTAYCASLKLLYCKSSDITVKQPNAPSAPAGPATTVVSAALQADLFIHLQNRVRQRQDMWHSLPRASAIPENLPSN